MAKDTARGIPDFEALLKRIDPGTRLAYYDTLLKGTGQPGQAPGMEKQFMDALIDYRGFKEQIELTVAAQAAIPEESRHEDVTTTTQREMAMMLHNLANQEARLHAIGNELGRVQAAIEELKGAGVSP